MPLSHLPNFCAHEHWGSLMHFDNTPDGFGADRALGARPIRPTHLVDVLLDPYFGGFCWQGGGYDLNALARSAGAADADQLHTIPASKALAALKPLLDLQDATGAWQCLRLGIRHLYGPDLARANAATLDRLDREIGERYASLWNWYRVAMERCRFSTLVRPMQPEYCLAADSADAREERAFTHTLLRIDPLMDFWRKDSARRDALAAQIGIDPVDLNSWRQFVHALFNRATRAGCIGIKQLQAYSRSLDFGEEPDWDVTWRGSLTSSEVVRFQNAVMHICCEEAQQRQWPHQVHVGTHNLAQSSPLPLSQLAARYPGMKLILLHCWPFLNESGHLAKHYPNIYLDTCWMPVLNPAFLDQALTTWLGYVPTHKFMLSHDCTSVEMAAGSAQITRSILHRQLQQTARRAGWTEHDLQRVAACMLNDNAVNVYGVGQRFHKG